MSGAGRGLGLLTLALIVVAAIASGSTVAPGRSGAESGTMRNCPPAGMWSISVWEGDSGTAAADALATCGEDGVAAAYSLDPQTGGWSRWFAGKPDVSDLPPLPEMQGVLALGGTAAAAAGGDSLTAAEASGEFYGCPPVGMWSIAVWDGASGTTAADALAACGQGTVAAAYSLDSQTGAWSRWFADKADVSDIPPLGDMQGVLALGAASSPAPTPSPSPMPTPTSTPASGTPQPGTYTGVTSQARAIQLDVADGSSSISRIEFDYEGTCQVKDCLCKGHVKTSFPISIPISDNAFSYSVSYYDMSGAFESTTAASGNLHAHITGAGGIVCDSGLVTWTASIH